MDKKNFDLPEWGFEPQIFSDEIKSKQVSKRDRTLHILCPEVFLGYGVSL